MTDSNQPGAGGILASMWPAHAPIRVRQSLALLWISWAMSINGLFYNAFIFGPGTGVGFVVGVALLILHMFLFLFLGRGSNTARIILLVLLVISIPGIILAVLMFAALSYWVATSTVLDFSLKVAAVVLLFTGSSHQWFKRNA